MLQDASSTNTPRLTLSRGLINELGRDMQTLPGGHIEGQPGPDHQTSERRRRKR